MVILLENATSLITTIIELLVGSITGIAEGIGSGLSALISNIVMTAQGGLSVFGTMMFIFMGISLAIGLSRFVLNWVTSLGKN